MESADTLSVFKERGGLQLLSGETLRLEISESGLVTSASQLTPLTLAPGTWLDSRMMHLDAPGSGAAKARGSVTFDTIVLGLVVTDAGLDSSDALLHGAGVDYSHGLPGRGAELTGSVGGDSIEISADRRTVTFASNVLSSLDQIRVITAVPIATCGPVAGAGRVAKRCRDAAGALPEPRTEPRCTALRARATFARAARYFRPGRPARGAVDRRNLGGRLACGGVAAAGLAGRSCGRLLRKARGGLSRAHGESGGAEVTASHRNR